MPWAFRLLATAFLPNELVEALALLPDLLAERVRAVPSKAISKAKTPSQSSRHSQARLGSGPILYWTHHAQRVDENPALEVSRFLSGVCGRPLLVYQGLSQRYRFASDRHHAFQLQAATDLQQDYERLGIRYALRVETIQDETPSLAQLAKAASVVVTDDFPCEPTARWQARLAMPGFAPVLAVDTACVVPMQLLGRAYDRAFAFRTATQAWYRERVPREWPSVSFRDRAYDGPLPFEPIRLSSSDLNEWIARCRIDHGVPAVADTRGGSVAGYQRWQEFAANGLKKYAAHRNDPLSGASSRMSAYLHYGMVSPMRLAREAHRAGAEKYLDELLIWRELAYGYCFYQPDHDRVTALPKWALQTLQQHESDSRPELMSWERLSRCRSGDRLWDACQRSLLLHGELHNNVRMTWGKAIVPWTRNAEEALRILIDLNHRYALDGRDPASYGGILWCLGLFDRPFEPEAPFLGTVRGRSTQEHAQRLNIDAWERHVARPISQRSVRLAMVGSGIAGTMAARTLADHGIQIDVFEKSRGVGGRCATRRVADEIRFDHGAPFAVFRDPRWNPWVDSWQQEGVLVPWNGRFVEVLATGETRSMLEASRTLYVGHSGMSDIGKHLQQDLNVRRSHRVESIRVDKDAYYLSVILAPTSSPITDTPAVVPNSGDATSLTPREFGPYDGVLWSLPAPQLHELVPSHCAWRAAIDDIPMEPCWALMVTWNRRWDVPWEGARPHDPIFHWMGRESSKPGRSPSPDAWVFHATPQWSRAHLEVAPETAAELLMEALHTWVKSLQSVPGHNAPGEKGIDDLPSPTKVSSHRWRYAQPDRIRHADLPSRKEEECFWDPASRLGACGDWIQTPGVEGALSSGRALAGRVMEWLLQFGPAISHLGSTRGNITESGYVQGTLFPDP